MQTTPYLSALFRRWRSTSQLIAKKNQPQLYEDWQLFFEDPEADRSGWQSAHSCNKGHGRLERREITTSTDLKSFFERDWQGIEQVFRLERNVTRKGKPRKAGGLWLDQFARQ